MLLDPASATEWTYWCGRSPIVPDFRVVSEIVLHPLQVCGPPKVLVQYLADDGSSVWSVCSERVLRDPWKALILRRLGGSFAAVSGLDLDAALQEGFTV